MRGEVSAAVRRVPADPGKFYRCSSALHARFTRTMRARLVIRKPNAQCNRLTYTRPDRRNGRLQQSRVVHICRSERREKRNRIKTHENTLNNINNKTWKKRNLAQSVELNKLDWCNRNVFLLERRQQRYITAFNKRSRSYH